MGNADTHRELHELFNTREFDAIVKRVTGEFRYVDHPRGAELLGGDAFKEWLSGWATGMSDARVTEARYVDAGATSVALFIGRGTHDGMLGTMPATGRELALPFCEVLAYDEDGNVTGGELYYDQVTMAAQLSAGVSTVVRRPGEGEAYWVLGGLYEVLLSAEESGGASTVMHMTIPAGMGPPPHTHPGTEAVYVLEGTLRYHIGDEVTEAGPGSFFSIPAATLERFEPTSTVRVLVSYSPGGIDRFFAEAGEPATTRELPPAPSEPPDLERFAAIAARYGMEILVPPGG